MSPQDDRSCRSCGAELAADQPDYHRLCSQCRRTGRIEPEDDHEPTCPLCEEPLEPPFWPTKVCYDCWREEPDPEEIEEALAQRRAEAAAEDSYLALQRRSRHPTRGSRRPPGAPPPVHRTLGW